MTTVKCRGITLGSLYRILFFGLLGPLFIFGTLTGICAFFGYATVTLNNTHVYGLKGLLVGMAIGTVLPALMSSVFSLFMCFGLWISTRFTTLKIIFID